MRQTAEHSVRREGKGRAGTGPSPSLVALLSAAVLVLALAAQFAFGTDARRAFSPEIIGVVSGLAAAVGVIAVTGWPRGLKVDSPMAVVIPLILGALALTAAPAIMMAQRYQDAPQGSEVLFLTTACWGAILALLAVNSWRRLPFALSAVIVGLAGVAGIVANWERPSSFSLFIRYQAEEAWMLVAGVFWALLWLWLSRAKDRESFTRSVIAAAVGGVLGAVMLALGRGVGITELSVAVSSSGLWLYAIATAVVASAGVTLVRSSGSSALAGTYFLPAAVLTALTILEQATTPMGPQPILLGPATAGIVTALAGCVLLWTIRVEAGNETPSRWPLIVSGVGVIAGLAGLALPALEAHVTGLRTSGQQLELSYVMRGYEAMGPWAALGLVTAVFAIALSGRKLHLAHALPLLAAGAAWPIVWATPLHTLTRFVPYEVQVDFGSEFASISFTTLAIPATLIALAGAGAGLALLLVGQGAQSAPRRDSRGDVS